MLTARFPNVAGVSAGTDVKVAGIKVGRVTKQSLDPASYEAIVEFGIDKALQLPIDSSAAITSEGLLGGIYVSLTPGGDSVMLKPGEEITETSGATDLMGLIGSVVNRSGDSAAPGNTPAAANSPAPAAAPAR
jgi:phospholipid/cholesterol/gamma-HCH transport system substrate-binding protein